MLTNLEELCIIVMYDASYHSVLTEYYPKTNSWKTNVQKWLEKKSIHFSLVETLRELQEKVKLTMPKKKNFNLTKSRYK